MLKFLKLSLLLVTILNISAIAQSKILQGKVEISNDKPLPNALIKVYLFNSENQLLLTTTSDNNGLFNFEIKEESKTYLIEISHALAMTYKGKISFSGNTDKLLIFSLKEKINQLDEVNIGGKMPIISRKNDKIIINVADNSSLQGKNFNQLIQFSPGIQIVNNEIFINGISGVKIYIDDRPLKMSGTALKNYLASINAADIKNIEILGSPPAEYGAEGTGGIININLRKQTVDGVSGYLGGIQSFGLGRYPSTNPHTSIVLKNNKFQLSARYNYLVKKEYFSDAQQRVLSGQSMFSSTSERKTLAKQNNLSFGISYDIDNMQNIAILYSGNYTDDEEVSQSEAKTTSSNMVVQENLRGVFRNLSKVDYNNFGLNYRFFTDTLKSKLSISGDLTKNFRNERSEIESSVSDYGNKLISDTLYNYVFPSTSNLYTAEAKYLKIFKSGLEVNLGTRFSMASINNENSVELFNEGMFMEDPKYQFNYLYDEQITAGFLEGSGKFMKLNFRVGLRAENTNIETSLNSLSNTSYTKRNYLNLFPSVYLGRDFGDEKHLNVSFSFNRRIARPSYSTLNPYMFYVDNNTISTGNPNLTPSFSNNFQVSFTLKNKYSMSLVYSNLSDQIQRVISTDESDIVYQIWQNVGMTRLFNVNISSPLSINRIWSTSNTLLLQYKEVLTNDYKIRKGTFVLQNNNEFEINKTLSLSLSTYYTPRSIYANTITKGYGDVSVGLVKKMWNNKLLVNVNVEDILYSSNPQIISYFNNNVIISHPKFQTRKLYLSIRYNFKSGKNFKRNTFEKSSADESERL